MGCELWILCPKHVVLVQDGKPGESHKHHLVRQDLIRELDKGGAEVNNHRGEGGRLLPVFHCHIIKLASSNFLVMEN